VLFGEGVRLRALERSDVPALMRWMNDPEIRRYLLAFQPVSTPWEERWVDRMQDSKEDFVYAIEVLYGGTFLHVGNTGLHHVDWRNRRAELGIVIGEKSWWGRGFGTEVVRTMLRFAFEELGLHRVELEAFDYNPRARRCYEKAGFTFEGTRRQWAYHEGTWHDSDRMGILRPEWDAREEAKKG